MRCRASSTKGSFKPQTRSTNGGYLSPSARCCISSWQSPSTKINLSRPCAGSRWPAEARGSPARVPSSTRPCRSGPQLACRRRPRPSSPNPAACSSFCSSRLHPIWKLKPPANPERFSCRNACATDMGRHIVRGATHVLVDAVAFRDVGGECHAMHFAAFQAADMATSVKSRGRAFGGGAPI